MTPSAPDVPKVLVAYASKHGSTAEIAEAIAAELSERGVAADCVEVGAVSSLEGYASVVLGSAVYMKRWRHGAQQFLKHHRDELAARPFWIFSSGPLEDTTDDAWTEPGKVVALAEELGVREHVVFGGALPADPHGFIEKSMVRNAAPGTEDHRDWDQIRAWADRIAAELAPDGPAQTG